MIFDTHAHYDDEAFDEDREQLLAGFKENGIGAVTNDNKKVKKGKSAELIASGLEEEVSVIQPLYDAVAAAAPEYDMEKIRQTLYGTF